MLKKTFNIVASIFLILGLTSISIWAAIYIDFEYRPLVRYFFNEDKIEFIGKNFVLFANPFSILSFVIFIWLFTFLIYKYSHKYLLFKLLLTIIVFFFTTAITSLIDYEVRIIDYDGINKTRIQIINGINYLLHFTISLICALMPIIVKKSIRTKKS